jgi:hypothetical protein
MISLPCRYMAGLVFAFMILVTASGQSEDHATPSWSERLPEFVLTDGTVLEGVKKLSSEQKGFSFGFENVLRAKFSDPPVTDVRFSLRLENKSVREILDALCEADRRYTWSAGDSFVNVYPLASVDDSHYLPNRKLAKLEIRNITDVEQGLLAIAQQLPPPEEQVAHVQLGGDASYPPGPWSRSFENLTVREAVNLLTNHMGARACWIFGGSLDFRSFAFFRWGFHSEALRD